MISQPTPPVPRCRALTVPARGSRPCANPAWQEGWCQLHHPVLVLGRLQRREARLEHRLARLRQQIAAYQSTGATATDHPGQLRIFEELPA